MHTLAAADLRRITHFLGDLYALRDTDALIDFLVTSVSALVPADVVGFSEFVGRDVRRHVARPAEAATFKGDVEALACHLHEHPIANHLNQTGDLTPCQFSDFVSRREYHELGLYQEFFRKIDVEAQIAVSFHARNGHLIGLPLMRSRGDFSERDRAVLTALQPHLRQAWINASAITALNPSNRCRGLVRLGSQGELQWLDDTARRLLARYFGDVSRQLPDALRRWLHAETTKQVSCNDAVQARRPYVKERAETTLTVRRIDKSIGHLLILEERGAEMQLASLRVPGLTPRETEILRWVAAGKTNAEIATIVGSSALTIKKHLEHVYRKLDVTTRAAAVAVAMRKARDDDESGALPAGRPAPQ